MGGVAELGQNLGDVLGLLLLSQFVFLALLLAKLCQGVLLSMHAYQIIKQARITTMATMVSIAQVMQLIDKIDNPSMKNACKVDKARMTGQCSK